MPPKSEEKSYAAALGGARPRKPVDLASTNTSDIKEFLNDRWLAALQRSQDAKLPAEAQPDVHKSTPKTWSHKSGPQALAWGDKSSPMAMADGQDFLQVLRR